MGTYLGSHDGDDPASEYMEALLDEHAGRIIISAAGNSGDFGKYHVEGHSQHNGYFIYMDVEQSNKPNRSEFNLWRFLV